MCILESIISSLVTEVGKCLCASLKKELVSLSHYKKNIENLKTDVEDLRAKRKAIESKVKEAHDSRLENPTEEVRRWYEKVDQALEEYNRIMEKHEKKRRCLCGLCPHWSSLYQLNKEALEKVLLFQKIIAQGNFNSVSDAPSSSSVEQIPDKYVDGFASAESALNQVMKALHDDNIKLIGVYGMAGVGKTTLVNKLNNTLGATELFRKVIKVTVSGNPDIKGIQETIAERLNLQLLHSNEDIRRNRLSDRLKAEDKVLIILDDVWNTLDTDDMGIPFRDEHKGCKIILTTRMEDICDKMGTDCKIKLKVLSKENSWTLFKLKAGDVVNSLTLQPIARKITESCGGLPLAIVTMASFLKAQKNDIVWKDALSALRNPTPIEIEGIMPAVIKSLRFSYDHLEDEGIKLFFLLCCVFPEDYDIQVSDLIHYGIGERLMKVDGSFEDATKRGTAFIDKLKASSLLLDNEWNRVAMHDVVRDVAISIASNEHGFYVKPGLGLEEWPEWEKLEGCKRISLMNNNISQQLPNQPECPQLLTLVLQRNVCLEMIPDLFFKTMKALVVLDLSNTSIQQLPPSVSCLKSLRTFRLNCCKYLHDIFAIGGLEKLEILCLAKSAVKELPEEMKGLTNLRHLDLTCTEKLKRVAPNVISNLIHLEELYMAESFSDWEVGGDGDGSNACFSEVASLTRLTALDVGVKNAYCSSQPYFHSCKKLIRYNICLGGKARKAYLSKTLTFLNTRILLADCVQVLISKSEELSIAGPMFRFQPVISEAQQNAFGILKNLSVSFTEKLQDIYSVLLLITSLEELTQLSVIYCAKVSNILCHHLLQKVNNLETISIHQCNELQEVFHYEGLAEGNALLPRLTFLGLRSVNSLTSIWKGYIPVGSLGSLKGINVSDCDSIRYLFPPALAQTLNNLEILSVWSCKKMEKLIFDEEIVMAADGIHPINLPPPSTFCNLQDVRLFTCGRMRYVFTSGLAQQLVHLKSLHVQYCDELEEIISMDDDNQVVDEGVFPVLKKFEISYLPKLTSVYRGNVTFDWLLLESMDVCSCPNLKRLPLRYQSAPRLKACYVDWYQCSELQWEDEGIKTRLQAVYRPYGTSITTGKSSMLFRAGILYSFCNRRVTAGL